MKPLVFHPQAEAEAVEAFEYYENRSHGLGGRFRTQLLAALACVQADPESHRPIDFNIRTYRLKTFAFALIYQVVEDQVEIIAVVHDKRRPGYWRGRLLQR